MAFTIPIATDNADAMKRVADRLQGDVGSLIAWAKTTAPPFWAIARSLFPIAESIAWLLHPNVAGTSERLSELLNQELNALNTDYGRFSHIVCQIWRHGLTHGDEPPVLLVKAVNPLDQRAMSWRLILPSDPSHLTMLTFNKMNAQFTFSLESFYDDLLAVCRNPASIAHFQSNDVSDRYNLWTVKEIDTTGGTQEQKKAAVQIQALLP